MQLLTAEQRAALLANGAASAKQDIDPHPVVKLFTPDAGTPWLLTELDPSRAAAAQPVRVSDGHKKGPASRLAPLSRPRRRALLDGGHLSGVVAAPVVLRNHRPQALGLGRRLADRRVEAAQDQSGALSRTIPAGRALRIACSDFPSLQAVSACR